MIKLIKQIFKSIFQLIKMGAFWTAITAIAATIAAYISYTSVVINKQFAEKQLQISSKTLNEQIRVNRPYITINVESVENKKYFQTNNNLNNLRIKISYINEGRRSAINFKGKLVVIDSFEKEPIMNKKSSSANNILFNTPFRIQFIIDSRMLLSKSPYIYIECNYEDPITNEKYNQYVFYKFETLKYPNDYYDFNIIHASISENQKYKSIF